MTHGRMEADHWYDKSINTGTEAYNYGMHTSQGCIVSKYHKYDISAIIGTQRAS